MKMKKRFGLILLLGLLGGLTGCSSSSDDGGASTGTTSVSVCDTSHLSLCITESTCLNASGNWYDNSCNSDPSSTWGVMSWDSGQWK